MTGNRLKMTSNVIFFAIFILIFQESFLSLDGLALKRAARRDEIKSSRSIREEETSMQEKPRGILRRFSCWGCIKSKNNNKVVKEAPELAESPPPSPIRRIRRKPLTAVKASGYRTSKTTEGTDPCAVFWAIFTGCAPYADNQLRYKP
nr:PREDICTED: uncharacterized protein LOC109030827 [Bemisia tabaci]